MAKLPLRFLFREFVPEFLAKKRRDPTFAEGFIFGLISYQVPGNINYNFDRYSDDIMKREKIELIFNIVFRELNIEFFDIKSEIDQNSILVDLNLKEFDGGLFDREFCDLTKFRGSIKMDYVAYWAISNEFICKNEISIKKMIGPAWNPLLILNLPFGLLEKNKSPSETGLALLFLKGLEKMVKEIKREARPTLIYRLKKWLRRGRR